MDGIAFDALTRSVAESLSRRRLTGLLGGLSLAGALASFGTTVTHAKQKKRKRKKRKPGKAPGGCRGDQKLCDEQCIPRSACCNNGDCLISGQICDRATRRCRCPDSLDPVDCGGACLEPCGVGFTRRAAPNCRCCGATLVPSGGNPTICCSGRDADVSGTRRCVPRNVDEICEFHMQCLYYCVDGRCSGCDVDRNYCSSQSHTCVSGSGQCLKSVDGTTRCGIGEWANEGDCGWCTSNFDCDQGQRPGAFCAVNTGTNCGCARGQTFCARPVPPR